MRRLLVLLALAAVPLVPFIARAAMKAWGPSRSLPTYATWAEYLEADAEGDALPPALRPDPRLEEAMDPRVWWAGE